MLVAPGHPSGTTRKGRERLIGLACGVLSVLLFASFTLTSRLGLSSRLAVPIVTTLAAIPLLSEHPSRVALLGVGVVTLGMIVAVRVREDEATGRLARSTSGA